MKLFKRIDSSFKVFVAIAICGFVLTLFINALTYKPEPIEVELFYYDTLSEQGSYDPLIDG